MYKGYFVGIVLLDLQKAFDTLDNDILLMKLESLGLSNDAIRWFCMYLADNSWLMFLVLSLPKPIFPVVFLRDLFLGHFCC